MCSNKVRVNKWIEKRVTSIRLMIQCFNIVHNSSSHIVRLSVLIFDQSYTCIMDPHSSSMRTIIAKLVQFSKVFSDSQKFTNWKKSS